MALGDRTYTRAVRGLKVTLPLVALVLLSTMFMLSRRVDPTAAIALSDQTFRSKIERSELTSPRYTGNTKSGQNMVVVAKSARPDPVQDGKTYGKDIDAQINMKNGEVMTVTADQSVIDETNDMAILSGNVNVITTDGYDFKTSQMTTLLSKIEGESAGPVVGFGPPGELKAGKMYVRENESGEKIHLLFTQGVHLIYHKQETE